MRTLFIFSISLLLSFPFSLFAQISISATDVCINSSVTANVSSGTVSTNSYSWVAVPPANLAAQGNSVTATFIGCGAHTISCNVYNSSNVLISTFSQTLLVDCATLAISPPSSTICSGASATLNALGASPYSWSTGSSSNSIVVSPLTNTLYQVFSGAGVCSATATVSIFNPTITATQLSMCPGTQNTLAASGATNYSWYNSSGSLIATGVSSLLIIPAAVPATYSLISTWGGACLSFKTISLALYSFIPKASFSSSVCLGTTASLSATAGNSFTWSLGTATATTPQFTSNQVAPAVYTLTADSAGCIGTRNFSIGIFPQSSLSISAPYYTICPNQSASLTASGALNYTWSAHPSMLSTLYSPSVLVSPTMITVYTVTGQDANNCKASATQTIQMSFYPQLNFSSTAFSLCTGYFATVTAAGAQSYTWYGGTSAGTVNNTGLQIPAGTYTLVGSNGGSCSDSLVFTIVAQPPLQITVSQSSRGTCRRLSGDIDPVVFTASGASSYTWAPFVPMQMTYSLGNSTSVTPSVTTCYTVTGSDLTCKGSATLCVIWGDCVSIAERSNAAIHIFHNPSEENFEIQSEVPLSYMAVKDLSGKKVLERSFVGDDFNNRIDISMLVPGLYYCEVQLRDGSRSAARIRKF